mmetsp:Transcript_7886/g.22520  ORF Transcript_7886/g.22520 Transcript_7886/m.22520 type:complete len:190 (+) Transcript_7886:463-1032(+)|eukprot:CAMPEP_0117651118 /NCGR_PEP_ID=MMETSP0804-20121206/1919_1 /TAXON_ID=1074897 /ORGANISM="Tetraselmis astigmatica, Strain CCMP880" /LENGTH=189 /DNA_ID=CAMNT_0005457069 /DNA_START=444 /DNA_END=1013 /DNA_ORIENTATION=+
MISSPPSSKPIRDRCLMFCRMVNAITAVCAFLCLVAHVMAVSVRSDATPSIVMDSYKVYRQIIRLCSIGLAVAIILVESEWDRFLAMVRILEYWVIRGFLQVFLAVLTLELATAEGESDFSKSVRLYRTVAGVSMLCCGGFYMLGGCLCFPAFKRARHRKVVERMRAHADLALLEKQREDLRNLLAEEV